MISLGYFLLGFVVFFVGGLLIIYEDLED